MSNEYSSLKMAWWYANEGGLPKAPKQVEVILSDLCNQDCYFCAYRQSGYTSNELFIGSSERSAYGHDNPKRFIPTERALALMDEIKNSGALAVQFTGGGEPTVHPEHEQVFRRARSLGLECALVSNGLRWSDSLIDLLPEFAWARVSVDAGNAEGYATIRNTKPGNFGKVLRHTQILSEKIRERKSACVLGVGFVVTPENWKQVDDGIRVASETGAAYIRMSAVFSAEGVMPFREIYKPVKDAIFDAKQKYETSSFKVVDLFGERIEDLEQGNPDYKFCSHQHYTTYIGGDLNAYRCCVYAYNKRGLIEGGSLKDRAFDEFWASDDRKGDFERFDARGCERCQFNPKNKAMLYIMGGRPTHAAFP